MSEKEYEGKRLHFTILVNGRERFLGGFVTEEIGERVKIRDEKTDLIVPFDKSQIRDVRPFDERKQRRAML